MNAPQGQYINAQGKTTPGIIRAHGEVKTRVGVLWVVGIVCCLLVIGGFVVFLFRPELSKDVWVIIGPIISAALSGTVSFLAAERANK